MRVLVCAPLEIGELEDLADLLDRPLQPLITPEYRWHLVYATAYGVDPPARFTTLARTLDVDPIDAARGPRAERDRRRAGPPGARQHRLAGPGSRRERGPGAGGARRRTERDTEVEAALTARMVPVMPEADTQRMAAAAAGPGRGARARPPAHDGGRRAEPRDDRADDRRAAEPRAGPHADRADARRAGAHAAARRRHHRGAPAAARAPAARAEAQAAAGAARADGRADHHRGPRLAAADRARARAARDRRGSRHGVPDAAPRGARRARAGPACSPCRAAPRSAASRSPSAGLDTAAVNDRADPARRRVAVPQRGVEPPAAHRAAGLRRSEHRRDGDAARAARCRRRR